MKVRDIKEEALKGARSYSQDFLTQDGYVAGFMEAVGWFLESVWHDASKEPEQNGYIIAINKDEKPLIVGPNNTQWNMTKKLFNIVKWAYLMDIGPTED